MPQHIAVMVLWSHRFYGTRMGCIEYFELTDDADLAACEELSRSKFAMAHYAGELQIVEFSCKEDAKEFVNYKMNRILSS
jgi:hypothetical protein